MDPSDQVRRLMRAYRAVRVVQNARAGHQKIKSVIDDHFRQSNMIMDSVELVGRIQNKSVRSEDVRMIGRVAINSAPRIYGIVAKHIKRQKNAKT